MLSERIRTAVERAAQLPTDLQEKLATEIETAVDNALWDAELRDPRNRAMHQAMIAAALADEKLPLPTARDLGIDEDSETDAG
jgi:hypothetical protein